MKRFTLVAVSSVLLLVALPVAETAIQHATASAFAKPPVSVAGLDQKTQESPQQPR